MHRETIVAKALDNVRCRRFRNRFPHAFDRIIDRCTERLSAYADWEDAERIDEEAEVIELEIVNDVREAYGSISTVLISAVVAAIVKVIIERIIAGLTD